MARKAKFNWYRKPNYAAGDYNPEHTAELYARWLASKQGIDLAGANCSTVQYTWNGLNGSKRGWADKVYFWNEKRGYYKSHGRELVAEITIPHSDFDPSAVDLTEPMELAA